MKIDKNYYQTVWKTKKGFISSVCKKGKHGPRDCSVIGINPPAKTFVTAELVPAKK